MLEKNPWFYESKVATGFQVCVKHKGEHEWVLLDATKGFCLSELDSAKERLDFMKENPPEYCTPFYNAWDFR
jgi:hypothetical protein